MALPTFPIAVPIRAIDNLTGPLGRMSGSLGRFGARASQVGRGLTFGVTAPLIATGAAVVTIAGGFEKSMNRVKALVGEEAAPAVADLEAEARKLGNTTEFSAGQAAGAMAFLAQAGFEVGDIFDSIGPTLSLASAAQVELAETADIASNVLTGFRLEAEDMDRVANGLTAGFANSNTNLVQLGEAMKIGGPVAAAMNQDFERTVAVVGAMGNAGFQASLAGTALRGSLSKLSKPSAEARAALAGLGIRKDDLIDAEGNVVDLISVVGLLEEKGASAADLLVIFGERAGPAMTALVGQGADAIEELAGEIENAGNIAERVAEIQLEGTFGEFVKLKSAAEELAIAIGESGLLADVTKVAVALRRVVQVASAADPRIVKLAVGVGLLVAAIGPALFLLGGMASGIGAIVTAVNVVVPALGAFGIMLATTVVPAVWSFTVALLANPIFWIAGAIVGVIAAGVLLVKHWDVVKAKAAQVWGAIADAVGGAFGWIKTQVQSLIDLVPDWLIDFISNPVGAAIDAGRSLFAGDAADLATATGGAANAATGRDASVRVSFDNVPPGVSIDQQNDAGAISELDLGFALGT